MLVLKMGAGENKVVGGIDCGGGAKKPYPAKSFNVNKKKQKIPPLLFWRKTEKKPKKVDFTKESGLFDALYCISESRVDFLIYFSFELTTQNGPCSKN